MQDPLDIIIAAIDAIPEGEDVGAAMLGLLFGSEGRDIAAQLDPLSKAAFTVSFRLAAALDWLETEHGAEAAMGFAERMVPSVNALVDAIPNNPTLSD